MSDCRHADMKQEQAMDRTARQREPRLQASLLFRARLGSSQLLVPLLRFFQFASCCSCCKLFEPVVGPKAHNFAQSSHDRAVSTARIVIFYRPVTERGTLLSHVQPGWVHLNAFWHYLGWVWDCLELSWLCLGVS